MFPAISYCGASIRELKEYCTLRTSDDKSFRKLFGGLGMFWAGNPSQELGIRGARHPASLLSALPHSLLGNKLN